MTTEQSSAPETGTTEQTATSDESTSTTVTGGDLEHWKEVARKNEARAKANAAAVKELEALKRSSMTDQQRAVDEAKAQARAEAMREVGGRLAAASIRVAAAGRNVDVDALLEGIDATKFLNDDGEVDEKAVAAWVDRLAPVADTTTKPKRDLGQGVRGGGQQSEALNGDPLVRALKSKLGMS